MLPELDGFRWPYKYRKQRTVPIILPTIKLIYKTKQADLFWGNTGKLPKYLIRKNFYGYEINRGSAFKFTKTSDVFVY